MITLIPITAKDELNLAAGKKAQSIAWLNQQEAVTPQSWVLPWEAFEQWQHTRQIDPQWVANLDSSQLYAVRSSANLEDDPKFAFAGQFVSVLNVTGKQGLLDAIGNVFQSTETELVGSYLSQNGLKTVDLKMGALIQKMIKPQISGVAFSKNPVTGLDEIVIEAVSGSGEKLVRDGFTPWRWVYKWGEWIIRPEDSHLTDMAFIQDVATQTARFAEAYGKPLDLEWVYDGHNLYWVQARPITTLQKLNIYSNRISKEVLPGIIKPLVWSTNIPLVNTAWIKIFTELIGSNDITPDELTKAIHYRAYFNMSTIGKIFSSLGMPEETLELLMGLEGGEQKPKFRPSLQIMRHVPRMVRFAWQKWRFAAAIERELPRLMAYYRQKDEQILPTTAEALLQDIDELFVQTIDMAYLNIVGPILAQIYGGMLNRQLKKEGVDPHQFDVKGDDPAFFPYDPNHHLHSLHELFLLLPRNAQRVVESGDERVVQEVAPKPFKDAFDDFLTRFGHLSDSGNDFSHAPWRENKGLVLQMIAHFKPAVEGGRSSTINGVSSLSGRGRRAYKRARTYQLYREKISSAYIFGYGLMRSRFLALGRIFSDSGVLQRPEDIFFLYLDEVRDRVAAGENATSAADLVNERRTEIERVTPAILPELVYGDEQPPLETQRLNNENILQGIPTSRGYYQGPVRVIRKLSDFSTMVAGEVLVIPFSDVSWTPLFAKAGAVIAESGGMLSHSSIVAREYNLPAVVSVHGATHQLQDGEIVSVDGFIGTITLHRNGA